MISLCLPSGGLAIFVYYRANENLKGMIMRIPVYSSEVSNAQAYWQEMENSMACECQFVVLPLEDCVNTNLRRNCIIHNASLTEVKNLLKLQRTFRFPFLFVAESLTADEILEVLRLGAIDVIASPSNTEEVKAKVIYHQSSMKDKKTFNEHEQIIAKAELTKVEEKIFRVIMNKDITTTAKNIFAEIWKGKEVQVKTFNVHISKLRKKLRSVDLDIKYTSDKTYHIIKKRSLEEHAKILARSLDVVQ